MSEYSDSLIYGLNGDTLTRIRQVFATFPGIESVTIYGSRALGSFREGSDIDLTLKGSDLDYDILARVTREIDGLNLPYLFDISLFHKIDNPDLIDHINRIGKEFYLQQ